MSRQIDVYGHKLTDEERAYLESRGRRHLIMQNDRMFSDEAVAQQDDEETWEDMVVELNVTELRAELGQRGLDTSGNKAELQARLIEAGSDDEQ